MYQFIWAKWPGVMPMSMAAIKVPGYTGKIGSHMWRNQKFMKAFSWLDTAEFSNVSATSGAENLALQVRE